MSSERTLATIEDQQRKISALRDQIQQAHDRDQQDVVPGLERQISDAENQVNALQNQLNDERQKEAEAVAEAARDDQKKKDRRSGLLDMLS